MASNEFFLINDIQKELYCSHCENRLDVPKILPCGRTICSKCETFYIHSSDKECKSCSQVHEIPSNGLPVNELVAKFLTKAPATVYRGEVHKQTMETVNQISVMIKNLQDQKNNVDSIVADYCDMLRTCVDIKTESEINQLNIIRDLFLEKIDKYEKECKDRSNEKLKLEKFIKECNENHAKWAQFLNKENISDKETSVVLKEATKQVNVLNEFRNKFENSIFGSRKLVFYDSIKQTSPSILGLITSCVNQKLDLQFNYRANKAKAYIKPILIKIDDKTVFMAVSLQLKNGTSDFYQSKLSIISDGVVVKSISEPLHQFYFNYLAVIAFKGRLVVHFRTNSIRNAIRMYDVNLNLVKSIDQNYLFSGLFTDEKFIYGYSPSSSQWVVLDENLNLLRSIEIGDGSEYPFIIHKDSQVELKYGYLFSYYKRELRVIDNEKRTALFGFKFEKTDFPNPIFVKPCSSDSIYVIDSTNKTVQAFDFKFTGLHEFKIDCVSQISSVSLTHDGELVVYDYVATTAYLFKIN